MADLDAGALGTMPSALLPDLIKEVLAPYFAGRRADAAAAYARIPPLINFENRQCGLRACKTVMKEGGVIRSDAVRHPLEPLHPATRAGLLELAAEVNPLALRWGRQATGLRPTKQKQVEVGARITIAARLGGREDDDRA